MVDIEASRHPLPKDRHPHRKYPWKTMEVGESFFVEELSHTARKKLQGNLSSNAGRDKGARAFVTKQVENGVRVWRVK